MNTIETFNELLNMGMNNASEVVLTGISAGGLATLNWANYLKTLLPNTTALYAVPDSGFFVDYPLEVTNDYRYRQWFINFMQLSNVEVPPIVTQCVSDYPQDNWKCMFAQYLVNYI